MTKGFMKDDQFHPITPSKGVRKSREQSTKLEGIKIRKKRVGFHCIKCGKEMAEANIGYDKMCHECFVEAKAERTMQEMIPRNVIEKYTRKYRDSDENLEEPDQLIIRPDYDVGDVVMIRPKDDNEGYRKFTGKKLRIVHVATNRDEHQGFDEGVGQALYDLETINGKEVPFSLYDYELVSA